MKQDNIFIKLNALFSIPHRIMLYYTVVPDVCVYKIHTCGSITLKSESKWFFPIRTM